MLQFEARVPLDPNGYRWRNVGGFDSEDEDYAEGLVLEGSGYNALRMKLRQHGEVTFENEYDAMGKEPALYRIFARLEPTEEAILQFANRYGDIAELQQFLDDEGSTLGDWRDAIAQMRDDVARADAYLGIRGKRKLGTKASESAMSLISERVEWISVSLVPKQSGGEVDIRSSVYGLLSVMLLQLVLAITERKQYRDCDLCGKPFELTPQVSRSDKLFCTDNCRVKAYHRRKKQAVEMRKKGATLHEIVKATRSDLSTVRGWVTDIQKGKE